MMIKKSSKKFTDRDVIMMSYGYALAGADKLIRFQGKDPLDPNLRNFRKRIAMVFVRNPQYIQRGVI